MALWATLGKSRLCPVDYRRACAVLSIAVMTRRGIARVAGNGAGFQIYAAPEGKLRPTFEGDPAQKAPRLRAALRHRSHTSWATHGRPSEENAHPHRDCTGKIVVVHNGKIIENYVQLKRKLKEEGHRFTTETDTEIIAHMVEKYLLKDANGKSPVLEDAVRKTVSQLTGVFALAVISVSEPNKIVAARNGPPAVIGLGKDEYFCCLRRPCDPLPYARSILPC